MALIGITASGKVKLPAFFADNMVLQQQSECNLWGWADPGTRVCITTSWDKKGHNVMANKYGLFSLKVKTPEAGGPYFIGFKDKDHVLINNVMIGEVWICAGQSNMEMQMKGFKQQPVEGTTEELLNCKDSQLRLFWQGPARHTRCACRPHRDGMGWFGLRSLDGARLAESVPQG